MINYQELKKIGLSDKESKIYLTSLSRGPETAPTLAKIANIVRPTAYVVIDSLVSKGLMSSFIKEKKTYYTAESPEHLLSLIHLQKKQIEETEREFAKLMPKLEAIANIKGEKPKVRVFEGKEGLQSIREQILKIKTKEIYSFIPIDQLYAIFTEKEHSEMMTQKRVGKKIKSKIFYTTKEGPKLKAHDKELLRETKFIDEKKYPLNAGIDIYDDYVAIYTFKGKVMGVIIENKDIAETLKTIFKLSWDNFKDKKRKQ